MTPEEKAEKWFEDNFPIFEAAEVCSKDFIKAYLAGYAEGYGKGGDDETESAAIAKCVRNGYGS